MKSIKKQLLLLVGVLSLAVPLCAREQVTVNDFKYPIRVEYGFFSGPPVKITVPAKDAFTSPNFPDGEVIEATVYATVKDLLGTIEAVEHTFKAAREGDKEIKDDANVTQKEKYVEKLNLPVLVFSSDDTLLRSRKIRMWDEDQFGDRKLMRKLSDKALKAMKAALVKAGEVASDAADALKRGAIAVRDSKAVGDVLKSLNEALK